MIKYTVYVESKPVSIESASELYMGDVIEIDGKPFELQYVGNTKKEAWGNWKNDG